MSVTPETSTESKILQLDERLDSHIRGNDSVNSHADRGIQYPISNVRGESSKPTTPMLFSVLKTLSLGIWLGALIMLGYAVAGPIFQQSPSKTLAGAINGVILGRMNNLEWICAGLALVSSLILLVMDWGGNSKMLRVSESVLILVMMGILWSYSGKISGRMAELRGVIQDFDNPKQTTEYVVAKDEFDSLHHTYTRLVSANMLLLLGTFVLSMVTAKR